jgi:hypothetical protein
MQTTLEKLKELNACQNSIIEWENKKIKSIDHADLFKKLMTKPYQIMVNETKEDKLSWANWLIVKLLTKIDRVRYAVFAAEQVINIFEKKYPDDKRLRQAIEAAKKYIENPTKENAAAAAADAAYAAAAYAMKIKILKHGLSLLENSCKNNKG